MSTATKSTLSFEIPHLPFQTMLGPGDNFRPLFLCTDSPPWSECVSSCTEAGYGDSGFLPFERYPWFYDQSTGVQQYPLVSLACFSQYGTSAIWVSWAKDNKSPQILWLPLLGSTSALQMQDKWRKGAFNFLASMARNSTSATWSWGWEMKNADRLSLPAK